MCPSKICAGCNKAVIDAIYCSQCNSFYHRSCLKLVAARTGSFCCCRETQLQQTKRTDASQSTSLSALRPPLSSQPDPAPASVSLSSHSSHLPAANSAASTSPSASSSETLSSARLLEDILRRMHARFDELGSRFDEEGLMRRLDTRFDEMRSRLDGVDERLGTFTAMQGQMNDNTSRISELERQNLSMAEGLKELQSTVGALQKQQASGLQELRRTSTRISDTELIISGAPCDSENGTLAVALQVVSALKVPLKDGDILSSRFLVPSSRARHGDSPLPIITRFRTPDLCRQVIAAKKAYGYLHTSDLRPPCSTPVRVINVNEVLPGEVYKLLVATRSVAKARGFKYVWHSNGVILLRRKDGERTRRIRSIQELEDFEAESLSVASGDDSNFATPAGTSCPRPSSAAPSRPSSSARGRPDRSLGRSLAVSGRPTHSSSLHDAPGPSNASVDLTHPTLQPASTVSATGARAGAEPRLISLVSPPSSSQ